MKKYLFFEAFILLFFVSSVFGFEPLFDTWIGYDVGSFPFSVFASDLDGDGNKDLAVTNWGNGNVSILRNYGDGTFDSRLNYATGKGPFSVFASDLDGDGDQDLIVANHGSGQVPIVPESTISVLMNNGGGTFATKIDYVVGRHPLSIFASDLDADGDQDLAVTNYGNVYEPESTISVLKNRGDGTFDPKVDYFVGLRPYSVFAADLDGDAALDLVVANSGRYSYPDSSVSVLKNNGDGSFAERIDYAGGGIGSSVSILKNNGNGIFTYRATYGTGQRPTSVYAADLDKDGDFDLAVTTDWSYAVSVLKNNGDGTFDGKVDYETGREPYSVYSSDLDGDGDQDLVVANSGSDSISVLKNNGYGTFFVKVDYWTGKNPSSVFASDLDGDGDQDLAVANNNSTTDYFDSASTISVLKNHGDRTFVLHAQYRAGRGPISVVASDLDGDGDFDLAALSSGNLVCNDWECVFYFDNTLSILMNYGDGTFAPKIDYLTNAVPRSVFASDLDKDGDQDLAVANSGWGSYYEDSTVSVFKNNGDGTFADKVDYVVGESPNCVFASDLDQDADFDLAVTNYYNNSVSVLKNNGDGTFADKIDYRTGLNPVSVFASDLDEDGDQDLAVVNQYSNAVSVLKNNGDGTFLDKGYFDYGVGNYPRSIFASDLDGDGDQDLAIANESHNTISVLKNTGFYTSCAGKAGDANGDSKVNLADLIFKVNFIFKGGSAPAPLCTGDDNADVKIDLSDIIYGVNYLFKGGPPPIKYGVCCL